MNRPTKLKQLVFGAVGSNGKSVITNTDKSLMDFSYTV
jgi:hypothetical protein